MYPCFLLYVYLSGEECIFESHSNFGKLHFPVWLEEVEICYVEDMKNLTICSHNPDVF